MPANESERREYQQHQTPGEQQLANLNHPSSHQAITKATTKAVIVRNTMGLRRCCWPLDAAFI